MTLPAKFWYSVERLHHFVYFAPEGKARYEATGLKGMWMGYFASRSAPMGEPSAEVVIATFHGFAPHMVHRAIPDAWTMADREDVLEARLDLARDTLAKALTDEQAASLADGLTDIIDGLDFAGKPLAAAHSALAPPDDPIGRFWIADSVLREYRGDCHVAILVGEGLGGVDANALAIAAGVTFPNQKDLRGWSDEDWNAGVARLQKRGWLDESSALTDAGRDARQAIEDATDHACLAGMSDAAIARATEITDDLVAASKALQASQS